MNDDVQDLLDNNRRWAGETEARNPGFFSRQGPQGAELPVGYLVGFSCSGYFVQQAPTLVDALTFDIHGLIS